MSQSTLEIRDSLERAIAVISHAQSELNEVCVRAQATGRRELTGLVRENRDALGKHRFRLELARKWLS